MIDPVPQRMVRQALAYIEEELDEKQALRKTYDGSPETVHPAQHQEARKGPEPPSRENDSTPH